MLILINKDAFEPSYNDLKSTVWNHDYICTNLMTNSMKTLKKVHIKKKKNLKEKEVVITTKCSCHMIQQSHSWTYIQKKL